MLKQKQKNGRIIIPNGVYPEKHELITANVFTKIGKDIEFVKPSKTIRSRNPDVLIDGELWEIKSPTGESKYTIQTQFKRAAKQARNMIFDSRRTKLDDNYIKTEISKQLSLRRSIKKIKLILKSGKIVDFIK